jgi:hypothetical protein
MSSTITQEQYNQEFRDYVASQMVNVKPAPGQESDISFWVKLNNQWKSEFDANLASQGVTVSG